MHGRHVWSAPVIVVALVAVVALGAGLAAGCGSQPGETSGFSPGETIEMRNGLTFVGPQGSSGGTIIRMPEEDSAGSVAEAVAIAVDEEWLPGEDVVDLHSLTSPNADGARMTGIGQPIARSADGAVAILWDRDLGYVIIETRLPGHLLGTVEVSTPEATSRREAWQEAQRVWEWLSIEGATLPRFGED